MPQLQKHIFYHKYHDSEMKVSEQFHVHYIAEENKFPGSSKVSILKHGDKNMCEINPACLL